ncbi:hypothetical protein F965_01910 [Acinetobacter schindleri NIPH 900]|jgi:hypothetical protein|uniref:Uncharacterized protein n=1 Tax=Acinetobacter schindleri NIPH 900 TaxID=1217675 RepID=N8WMB5_9GAMM|nr:hypothetical protein F965_01910 [Acinetobacter schindleri NIPH 900]
MVAQVLITFLKVDSYNFSIVIYIKSASLADFRIYSFQRKIRCLFYPMLSHDLATYS